MILGVPLLHIGLQLSNLLVDTGNVLLYDERQFLYPAIRDANIDKMSSYADFDGPVVEECFSLGHCNGVSRRVQSV